MRDLENLYLLLLRKVFHVKDALPVLTGKMSSGLIRNKGLVLTNAKKCL